MITLNGTLQDHGGGPITGQAIIIMPTPSVTIDTAGDVVHLGGTEATTDEMGFFTADLAHAPGLTYTARSTAGGRLRPVRFSCDDLDDGSTIDLSDVTPAPAPSPLASYVRGASAYELWLSEGNTGTLDDFFNAYGGADGTPGLLALTPTATPGVLQIGA